MVGKHDRFWYQLAGQILLLVLAGSCGAPPASQSTETRNQNLSADTASFPTQSVDDFDITTEYVSFKMSDDAGSGTFMDFPVPDFIQKAYYPDELIPFDSIHEDIAYTITSTQVIEGEYTNQESSCSMASALLSLQSRYGGEEEVYTLFFVTKIDNEIVIQGQKNYDGNYARTSGSVRVSDEYGLGDGCKTLMIEHSLEGGDIDLSRDESLSIFLVGENGFYEVLNLILQRTRIREYEATGDESKNSISEIRTFEILPETTRGMKHIKVRYTLKKDGQVESEDEEIYVFDGEKYSQQIQ